jgi:hypothetical protein
MQLHGVDNDGSYSEMNLFNGIFIQRQPFSIYSSSKVNLFPLLHYGILCF